MTGEELETLFSQSPASFTWTDAPPARGYARRIGTSEGAALEIEERAAVLIAIFPPDRADIAARNGTLMELLLVALRRDWTGGPVWLSGAMRDAARSKEPRVEVPYYSQRVWFVFNKRTSQGTLRVEMT